MAAPAGAAAARAAGCEGRRLLAASPGEGEAGGADDVGRSLPLELLGAAHDAEIDAERRPGIDRDAGLEVGHQRLLVDAAAGAEAVAVEEDVAPDGAALRADEDVVAEAFAQIVAVEI